MTFKEFLETLVGGLLEKAAPGCKAKIVMKEIPNGAGIPDKKFVVVIADAGNEFARPLLAVICPPTRFPVQVTLYHADAQATTTRCREWGICPNCKLWKCNETGREYVLTNGNRDREFLDNNPPTIDDFKELETVIRGLFGLELAKCDSDEASQAEMTRILAAMADVAPDPKDIIPFPSPSRP